MQSAIAIIGIGCRFPGAAGPRAFWQLLSEGKSAIARMPAERHAMGWIADGQDDPWGGFLQEVDRFDAGFFGICADEAQAMDPQQRLLLETAWEALEDAAVIPRSLAGTNTGVFMGISAHNYASLVQRYPDAINRFSNTGTGGSVAANRISYFLDLQGPGFGVDGACASSLLAVHLACRSIWANESGVALAGGVNLTLLSGPTLGLAKSGLLSPDGVSRIFDAGANGSVRGEGAAVVVLKSLPQAQADGDPIYAVIRGTSVNQNGRSNGLGAPSRRAQEALLRQAYRSAGISPGKVQYLETHSTASLIGDATELAAAGAVYQEGRAAGEICRVGSVKPNIGHLEAAAGIAGLIKTALMLKHERLAPTLNYRLANPHVPLDRLALGIQTELSPWPGAAGERVAGLSAAGYGGVNVHIVLGDAPPITTATGEPPPAPHLFTLSAKTSPALRQSAARVGHWLDDQSDVDIADVCFTANHRRTRFAARLAIVANDRRELSDRLRLFSGCQSAPGCFDGSSAAKAAASDNNQTPRPDDAILNEARAFVEGGESEKSPPSRQGRRVHGLPGYCFQRERYWLPTGETDRGIVDVPPDRPIVFGEPKSESSRDRSAGAIPAAADDAHDPQTARSPVVQGSHSLPHLDTAGVAPSAVGARVISLFEEVLGVSPVGLADNFFTLGGQSAQVLQLFSHVESTFGKTIPLIHFYESPTPAHLASMIEMDETKIHWKPVITLNEAGRRPPLFFVPGLGGHAFAMRTFAQRLGPDQPISVMHPHGLDPHTVALTSIEEMARVFLGYMRASQPKGPYHLGGYSFGGSVAFEIACQLRALGETVKTLTLLDAYAPGAFSKRSLPRRLVNHARMIYGTSHRRQYMKRRMGRLWDRLRAAAAGEQQHPGARKPTGAVVDAVRRVTFANQQAWRAYRPGRFDGRISLFRAADTDPMIAQFAHCDERNGWGSHVDEVDLLVLPCHHLKLFEGASLDLMTDRIASLLQPSAERTIVLAPSIQNKLRAGA
ncbi:MAG TPA: beta-ketoacyl synthase N-terminal-like domain-containing protein [Tepidisphaeraceae bacterium]|jgi:3-oxoacyl-(acyl-carrier-protein) synthase/thioesterase domain-containing protein/acyl carrier protein|nr:beta-ketoacyl synthase N-terminal-like domain-containing protein [Tepidisphaeraceae bacterium]